MPSQPLQLYQGEYACWKKGRSTGTRNWRHFAWSPSVFLWNQLRENFSKLHATKPPSLLTPLYLLYLNLNPPVLATNPGPMTPLQSTKKPPLSPTKRSLCAEFRSLRNAVSFFGTEKGGLAGGSWWSRFKKENCATTAWTFFCQKCKETWKSFERLCLTSQSKRRAAEQLYRQWPTIGREKWRTAECQR